MDSQWHTMLSAVLAIFAVTFAGLAARRAQWLKPEADATLLKLAIYLLLPALILHVLLGNDRVTDPRNMTLSPLVGFGSVVLGFVVAAFVAHVGKRLLGLEDAARRRTFILCIGIYNYGYVPIPLAESMFDDGGGTLGVLFVHNTGVEIALWTVGMMVISGTLDRHWWRRLINPPLVVIVAALSLNLLGLDAHVPDFARKAMGMLGACAIPVALLLIGATIADHWREARFRELFPMMTAACTLRLGVLPVLFLLGAWLLPSSVELKRVIVLEAAMPAAVFPIVMARHYHGHTPTAIGIVIATSLLSLLTMPLWVLGGLAFLGLAPAG